MKKLFNIIIFLFTFLLSFICCANASDTISSITVDNSFSFISINSNDNTDNAFTSVSNIYNLEEEKKLYFDINNTILKTKISNMAIGSNLIDEIKLKQISTDPDIVRVEMSYKENFEPTNIRLKHLNNTLFIQIAQPQLQNFYFQQIYSDLTDNISKFYNSLIMKLPVQVSGTDLISQINSAFDKNSENENNYVYTQKNLKLPTKYYIDNVNIQNGAIHIIGSGQGTMLKPFILANPTRSVYDIANTTVNPEIRNKEYTFGTNESIKIGQFDKSTARIVINSANSNNYVPIIFADLQHISFVNKNSDIPNTFYNTKTNLTSITDEAGDIKNHSMKLVFSKPIIYSIERTPNSLDLYLFNVDKYRDVNTKSSKVFENVGKFIALKNSGVKLSITCDNDTNPEVFAGADGKTLRIKIHSNIIEIPDKPVPDVIAPPIITVKKNREKKVIVIDPGHGGTDCGATRNNIYEKDITLDIAKRVETILNKKGYEIYLTRETDATLSLQERVEISEEIDPEIFVSIHVNSSNSDSPNGLETHYYKDNSLILAKTVHASMLNHIKANNRGLFKSKFYVINHTTAPAILVEIGFISNPSERAQIVTESRKQATAKAIAEGIDDYFKEQY